MKSHQIDKFYGSQGWSCIDTRTAWAVMPSALSALWVAVIAQAFRDWWDPKRRSEIQGWAGTTDFWLVADYAGLETAQARQLQAMLLHGVPPRPSSLLQGVYGELPNVDAG